MPMEKFVITVIWKTILRSAVHEIEKLSMILKIPKLNQLLLTNKEFFLDTINLERNPKTLVSISQIKNEPSKWNITLESNGTPISCKMDTRAQSNVKSLEHLSPKPDLQPVNVKLSVYNGSKIPVGGTCSLTLSHKNISFKFSFIVLCIHSWIENKQTFTSYT